MRSLPLIKGITFLVIILCITTISYSQQSAGLIKTVSGKTIDVRQLNASIEKIMDSLAMPGLSIGIINNSRLVYHQTFGVTNIDTKQKVTAQTIFEAASLSKPVFAYFVMKLVEEEKIKLDEPFYPFLEKIFTPETVDSLSLPLYKTLTPRIVLCHATGIGNWAGGKPIHIDFPPGTGFSYSGEAYQHLAAAIGTKLGIGWKGKLDSLFLLEMAHPLGMFQSFYTWNDVLEKNKATGHRDGKANTEIHRDKAVGPGYSLHSEAHDYCLFLIEMMQGKHLRRDLLEEMLKKQNHFKAGNDLLALGQTGWGLGFAQKPTKNGLMHLHTGNNSFFQSYAMFVPDQQYGIALFTNSKSLFPFIESLGKIIEEQF